MLSFRKTNLEKLIIHRIGNKSLEEGVILSQDVTDLNNNEVSNLLLKFFLKSFENLPSYSFSHPAELEMNEVYKIAKDIFASDKNFIKNSQSMSRILYDLSSHPKIKAGELYVAIFSDCEFDNTFFNAIGLFKSENIEPFLKIEHNDSQVNIQINEGINLTRPEKGCLILNTQESSGFVVYTLDNSSKSNEALYWKDDFLKLVPLSDNYHFTNNLLHLTKQYVTNSLPNQFQVSKTDQIDYLNKSVEYFKENEQFNIKEFENEVFGDPDIIKAYQKFGSSYLDENNIDIADSFEISSVALKKQARVFKSVLKLDKNFHIYIHGNKEMIENGVEKDGRKYYKIYYENET